MATSTLAWGVNTPAHLVIIKGTEFFDAPTRCCTSFPHGADIQGWFCLCRHVKAMIAAAPHSTPNQGPCKPEILPLGASHASLLQPVLRTCCPPRSMSAVDAACMVSCGVVCALLQTSDRPDRIKAGPEGACTCRFLDTHSLYTAVRRYRDRPVTDILHLRGLML